MPSMPRWIRTSSAGIQLMSVVACIVDGWSWSKPSGQDDRGDEDGAGDGHAVPQHGLVGAAAPQPGRGGQKRGGGAEERADDDRTPRRTASRTALISITAAQRSRGDEDGGDARTTVPASSALEVGLHVAGLGAAYGGAEQAG